jgi:hypothetical protein
MCSSSWNNKYYAIFHTTDIYADPFLVFLTAVWVHVECLHPVVCKWLWYGDVSTQQLLINSVKINKMTILTLLLFSL